MAQDTLKSLKIAYIFIVTLIVYVALIPLYSKRCRKSTVAFGMLNSFAGGVFLTMALVHILPEAVNTYNEQMKTNPSSNRLLSMKVPSFSRMLQSSNDQKNNSALNYFNGAFPSIQDSQQNSLMEKYPDQYLDSFYRQLDTSTTSNTTIQEDSATADSGDDEEEIFPLPYVLFFLGYTVILLIDRIVSVHFGVTHHHGHAEGEEDGEEHDHNHHKSDLKNIQAKSHEEHDHKHHHSHKHNHNHKQRKNHSHLKEEDRRDVSNSSPIIKQDDQENQIDAQNQRVLVTVTQQIDETAQLNIPNPSTSSNAFLRPSGDDYPLNQSHEVQEDELESNQPNTGIKEINKSSPSPQIKESKQNIVKVQAHHQHEHRIQQHHDLEVNSNKNEEQQEKQSSQSNNDDEELHHHVFEHNHLPKEKVVMVCGINLTPMVLLIALGFHSIFEGIALGLIKELGVFIDLMIGITIHHVVVCLSYGISLAKTKSKSKFAMVMSIVGLSLFESGGLAIGLGLNDAPELVSSIILSFAGGTFIYIACSEILVHEFSSAKHRYWKFLCFILGSGIIIALWFITSQA